MAIMNGKTNFWLFNREFIRVVLLCFFLEEEGGANIDHR